MRTPSHNIPEQHHNGDWDHLAARGADMLDIQCGRQDHNRWKRINGLSSSATSNNNTMAGVCLRLKILAPARTLW
jgi:hypothetical protein